MNLKNLFKVSFVALAFSFAACNNVNKTAGSAENHVHDHSHEGHEHAEAGANNPAFENEKVAQVYQHYIHLKDALVKADNADAQKAAEELEKALIAVNGSEIANQAQLIVKAADLESKRGLLDKLSNQLVDYFTKNKPSSGVIYVQNCPMANSDAGGSWLASEKQVNNPYYGDKMLKCGTNISEIKL